MKVYMLIQRAYKTELKPNQVQVVAFMRHCGTARFAYNWALRTQIKHYEATGKTLSWIDLNNLFNSIKREQYPWTYEVSKWCANNAIRNCGKAFDNFFRRLKQSGPLGFPKFKSKHRSKPSYTVSASILVKKSHVRLPKIGWIRLKQKGYIPTDAKISSVTVSQRAGRWFVSVQVEEPIDVAENQGAPIGLDLGIKTFIVGSDGARLESPKPLKASLKRLQRLSRQHSRKVKGSNNRRKSAARLGRLHYRIACQRADFLHKASHKFSTQHATVCIEDLNVKGMVKNRCLSRAISDAGWGEFCRMLGYKCNWYGSELRRIDRWYPSSKTCSACGFIVDELPLPIREWTCESCGTRHDRDHNAAKNILNQGTAGCAGTAPNGAKACGELPVAVLCEAGNIEKDG